ncbi:hypothetical protein BBJ28_00013997 [Nothophytophthora sp. Chile5]|nr:hypothetical protein BBJ28_00013997 [Nothophytophthora sp. Chile5]
MRSPGPLALAPKGAFNRYTERLEELTKAMALYTEATQSYANASTQLMHSFSAFFESQLQNSEDGKSTALRVEEIQQSLRENVFDVALDLQQRTVMSSLQELRRSNFGLNQQLRTLKQKARSIFSPFRLSDYDAAVRNADSQKKSPPDYEKAQQKLQATTASLAAVASDVDAEMSALEARRDSDLKNELLTVVATQLFVHSRAQEHLQQLVPLIPGVAKPLVLLLAEAARRRRPLLGLPSNPTTTDVMGVLSYAGEGARGILDMPLHAHRELLADVASVHPIAPAPFKGTHVFKRKGWEYSAYLGMLGGPIVLYLGLTNIPETDSEVFARCVWRLLSWEFFGRARARHLMALTCCGFAVCGREEALAKRAGAEFLERRPSGPMNERFAFKQAEIGEPPSLD